MQNKLTLRPFGASGLRVSEIGFGCGPTGGLMVNGSLKERCEVVAQAVRLGITLFDTAPVYGHGLSESNLGETLEALDAPVDIATKVVLSEDDFDDLHGAVLRSVEESLKRLRRDRVAIVHLHNRVGRERAARPNIGVGALLRVDDVLGPVAEALQTLKRSGTIDAIGCCAFGGEMPAAKRVVESGLFDGVLVNYSALNPSAFAKVPAAVVPDYAQVGLAAANRNMGIVALRILEGGALVEGNDTGSYRDQVLLSRFLRNELLRDGLQAAGLSLKEAATRFALFGESVSTALVGISNLAQLEEIVAYARNGPLSDSLKSVLGEAVRDASVLV
jgi:aryl-alcohol dehydrogenase-like predicted oxidoreductase